MRLGRAAIRKGILFYPKLPSYTWPEKKPIRKFARCYGCHKSTRVTLLQGKLCPKCTVPEAIKYE